MELTLNGRTVVASPRPDASLLEVLRGDFGLRSMKDGCAPEGSCGACTVIVDGRAVVSCAQPAARFAGRSVLTLEGLPAEIRDMWADAMTAAARVSAAAPGWPSAPSGVRRSTASARVTAISCLAAQAICAAMTGSVSDTRSAYSGRASTSASTACRAGP